MAKVSPLQGDFTGGEFSPLAHGHVSTDRYKTGLDTCLNYIPTVQGALVRRPGTEFGWLPRDPTRYTRLIPFKFNDEQNYVIELGYKDSSNIYFRPYLNGDPILNTPTVFSAATKANPCVVTYVIPHGLSNGDRVWSNDVVGMTELNRREFIVTNSTATTFELRDVYLNNVDSTNYGTFTSGSFGVFEPFNYFNASPSFLPDYRYVQSADALYLVNTNLRPLKLTRSSATSFSVSPLIVSAIGDGPYLPINATSNFLTASGTTGTVTVTAFSTSGINGGSGFSSNDVGRLLEMGSGYGAISGFTSTTVVSVGVIRNLLSAAATTAWRLGLFSDYEGYPSVVGFFENRLVFGGCENQPTRLDFSVSNSYEDFSYHDGVYSIEQSHAINVTLSAQDLNKIQWVAQDEKGFLVGSSANEWVIKGDGEAPISPLPGGATGKISTSYGSKFVEPVKISKSVVYAQRSGRKIREMFFDYNSYGFKSPELTPLAEHLTSSGVTEMAAQKEWQPIVWAIKSNGDLIGITLDRELDTLIAGWHRHTLGGSLSGGDVEIESIVSISSEDQNFDQIYMVTIRTINGVQTRVIERFSDFFQDTTDKELAWHMDCALRYDNPISDITFSNAAECLATTVANHGLVDGDEVYITDVLGMTELNNNRYVVDVISATTFKLQDYSNNYIDSSSYGTQVAGTYGTYREYVTTISGLSHLDGETVNVFADGGVRPDEVVSGGKIVLNDKATTVLIGYNYTSQAKMLRLEAGAQDGTALGKTRRTHRVGFFVHRTAGLKTGPDFDNLHSIEFPDSGSERGVPLYSGIISETMDCDYDFENKLCWQQDQPFPSTILAVLPQMATQDRG